MITRHSLAKLMYFGFIICRLSMQIAGVHVSLYQAISEQRIKDKKIMEILFLTIIQALSDSRFWLGPLLLICVSVIAIREVIDAVQD